MSVAALDTNAHAQVMLICVDPRTNANKFYEVLLGADGIVRTRYGRVGEPGKAGVGGRGQHDYDKIVRSKKRKGYTEAAVEGTVGASRLNGAVETKRKAVSDLAGDNNDPRLASLIDRIVAVNAHDIALASGGKLTVAKNGAVSTPLGLLTLTAIDEAGAVLDRLAADPTDTALLTRYLTLVPQNVGRSRDWTAKFFSGNRSVDQQRDFLDQLRQSVTFAAQSTDDGDDGANEARAFAYKLTPVDDKKVIDEITRLYTGSRNTAHPSSNMRVTHVYAITADSDADFEQVSADLGNTRRLWHGTSASNVLSILSTGLRVPRSATHGFMFGAGLYFSEQSTKSLNYSRGGVWSGSASKRCMMFVADVAMGHEYRPNVHGVHPTTVAGNREWNEILAGKRTDPKHSKPFTSINVRAGTAGVRNHESIVPGPKQVALRYLVEFEE